ncbi:MAG: hypothetical protein ACJ8AO_10575 [Gemmatimonadaceae bacterium]
MRSTVTGRALAAPALLLIALAGCADDGPTSPTRARRAPPTAPLASFASAVGAGTVTVYDDYGVAYTLDPARAEIRSSDGYIFELTASDLANATTAFVGAYEGDRAAGTLAAAPPPTTSTDCELGLSTCDHQWDASDGGGSPFVPEEGAASSTVPAPSGVLIRRSDAAAPGAPLAAAPDADLGAAPLYLAGGSCQDIAGAIYDATAHHRATRDGVLNVLKGAAAVNVTAVSYGIRIRLANIQGVAFKLEVAAHDQLVATTQLNILATMYASYGCWTGSWGGGTVGGTSVAAPSIITKVCHSETWEISFDSGNTWNTQEIQVCEYRMS